MFEESDRELGRGGRPGHRGAARGAPGALGVCEHHSALVPTRARRAIRDGFGAVAKSGRRRGARAADRPCRPRRTQPARAVGGGRCRRRPRVGRRAWLGGSRKEDPRRARDAIQIGTASTALTSVAGGLLVEKGRLKLDDEIQTYVPAFPEKQWPVTLRQVMGHLAGVPYDGGDEGELFSEHCERPVEALQYFAKANPAVRAGDSVPLFELWLDPDERGRRSRGGRAVSPVHAEAGLRAARHRRHDA